MDPGVRTALTCLKALFDEEFVTKDEYNQRRNDIVDQATARMPALTATIHPSPPPSPPVEFRRAATTHSVGGERSPKAAFLRPTGPRLSSSFDRVAADGAPEWKPPPAWKTKKAPRRVEASKAEKLEMRKAIGYDDACLTLMQKPKPGEWSPQKRLNFHVYITVTFLIIITIYAVCMIIGVRGWVEPSSGIPSTNLAGAVLETDSPWFKPTQDSPTSSLTDTEFLAYLTIVLWIVTVVTGLGMEFVIGEPLIAKLNFNPVVGFNPMVMQASKCANLVFALSVAIALFSKSPFGYPFMVVGLWKFGFPETIGNFRRAFRMGQPTFESAGAYINGVGSLIHNATAAYLIVACSTTLIVLDRRLFAISVPLVVQHILVLVRYSNMMAYGLLVLAVEIVFEWEIYANIGVINRENGYDVSCRGTVLAMLFAHWCYWAAVAISFLQVTCGSGDLASKVVLRDLARRDRRMVSARPSSSYPERARVLVRARHPTPLLLNYRRLLFGCTHRHLSNSTKSWRIKGSLFRGIRR